MSVDGEQVCLPQRIALPAEPQLVAGNGNEVVQTILACLATRHPDGFVRERAISYWNAYHRDRFLVRCPGPADRWPTYPAFPLLDTLHRAASEMREDVR